MKAGIFGSVLDLEVPLKVDPLPPLRISSEAGCWTILLSNSLCRTTILIPG